MNKYMKIITASGLSILTLVLSIALGLGIIHLTDFIYYIDIKALDISGRTGPKVKTGTDISVVIKDAKGNEVYNKAGKVTDDFGYIDRIPTDSMEPGEYKIFLTVKDKDGKDYVREIPITLKRMIVITSKITTVELTDEGIKISGNIFPQSASHDIRLHLLRQSRM